METVRTLKDIDSLKENRIIAGNGVNLKSCIITFHGKNNILYAEDGVVLEGCDISFGGDHAVVYLSKSSRPYHLAIKAFREAAVFFGHDNYFNNRLIASAAEHQNVIVGNDCLFSFGCSLRTADAHPLYSVDSGERICPSRSVFVGDHVWMAQDVLIMGSEIGSGAVLRDRLAAAAVTIPSNTLWAGNPAQQVEKGVFYTNESVHNWNSAQTNANQSKNTKEFIYKEDGVPRSSLEKIDILLKCQTSAQDRLEQIQLLLANCTDKNRFFIPAPESAAVASPASNKPASFRQWLKKES